MMAARPMGPAATAPTCAEVPNRAEELRKVPYPPMGLTKDLKDAETNTYVESSRHAEDHRYGFGLRHRQGPANPDGHYLDPEELAYVTNQGNPTNLAVPGKTRKRGRLSKFFSKCKFYSY